MKKYYVNGTDLDSIEEAMAEVMEEIDEYVFEEYLHEEYGYYVNVCDCEFDPVDLLRAMGYYGDRFSDWKDEIRSDVSDALEALSAGDTDTIYGVDIELIDEDEELFTEARSNIESVKGYITNMPTMYGGAKPLKELEALSAFVDEMGKRVMEEE